MFATQETISKFTLAAAAALIALLIVPALSWGHVERASYWPDPAPDCSVKPCAGGTVPKARTLGSALQTHRRSVTRVVCQSDSLERLQQSIKEAQTVGYVLRPTQPRKKIGLRSGSTLLERNEALFAKCAYSSIQAGSWVGCSRECCSV